MVELPLGSVPIDPRRPLGDQIRELLRKQNTRAMDLFRSLDVSGDGLIQNTFRGEFGLGHNFGDA